MFSDRQNGFADRWIGSLRRDCLDHVIAINERQLRRVIRSYVDYYHADRTHLGRVLTLFRGQYDLGLYGALVHESGEDSRE